MSLPIKIGMLYPTELGNHYKIKKFKVFSLSTLNFKLLMSGWQDSNLRPPGPKPGAMTGLRYTPSISGHPFFFKGCKFKNYFINSKFCGERGIRTPGTVTRSAV